jgi:hypothetical protein
LKRNPNHESRRPGQRGRNEVRERIVERHSLQVIESKIPLPDYASLDRLYGHVECENIRNRRTTSLTLSGCPRPFSISLSPINKEAKKRNKSEECANYPLHFFWSRFFTSSDGNPLIGDEIDSQKKRKRPGKKVKSGGSDPTFDGFQPPKVLLGRSRPSRRKRDRVLAACKLEPMKVRMRILLNGSTGRGTKCPF